jgi:hypothetical protein
VPPNLISWWTGDGNANDIIAGNNAVLQNGATFGTGKVRQAFSFDGVDDRVVVANNSSLNPTAEITVEAWINSGQHVASADPVIKKAGEGANQADGYALEFAGNGIKFFVYTSAGWFDVGPVSIPIGTWVHVAGSYNGQFMHLYVNGELASSRAVTGPIIPSSNELHIGGDPANLDRHYNGLIDEAHVYNRALLGSEVANIYLAGSSGICLPPAGNPATLLHHYTFNGNANDQVGTANGTLQGAAVASNGILTLNGATGYVQFASQIVPTSGSYSVALFAQELALTGNFVELISQGFAGGPGFYIGHDLNGIIRVTDAWLNTSVPFAPVGEWHHYAVVVDSLKNQTKLFVDGVLRSTTIAITTGSGGTNTRLGRQYDPATEFLTGNLSNARIYQGALTNAEVASLAAQGPGGGDRRLPDKPNTANATPEPSIANK